MSLNPNDFKLETTSVWSFVDRGNWATHSGTYRGNWSPYVPRNLILRYSQPNDWILDQFVGGGTSLVEAKLLNRNAIGIDINKNSIEITKNNLAFQTKENPEIIIKLGDAKKLDFIKCNSIDLICTHPPYCNIIKYSNGIKDDLSLIEHSEFLEAMQSVALESYRVLKEKKICAVMMGDIRKNKRIIPLGMEVMNIFLKFVFKSKEIVIKRQHNCHSSTYWRKQDNSFLLLEHEYVFIFEK